jgi:glycine dehydrogenase subunit 2
MGIPCCDIPDENVPFAVNAMPTVGGRGLAPEEPLLFEIGSVHKTGVSIPEVSLETHALGECFADEPLSLHGLTEPEAVRHYTRLSQLNYSIDGGFYPLGSCTMKHNPRLNEKMARLPGFAMAHPLQPLSTMQGCLAVMGEIAHWLKQLTGLPAVALWPAAGAHGELCGMMTIKAALSARGEKRQVVLVPESAHGTNPATAAGLGFEVKSIPANKRGRLDLGAFKAALDGNTAAAMITNPNTCGLFEEEIHLAAQALHDAGGYLYCDGANFNAVAGRLRVADLGVDAMHINLHKTFSTPHGGGGPGSGPVVLSAALAPYAPLPYLVHENGAWQVKEHLEEAPQSIGRLKAYFGQFGTLVRALSYMMAMGSDGLHQAASDAVLCANYIRKSLDDLYSVAYDDVCMHEVLFDDRCLKGTGVTTLDLAKALIDKGFHPMTMYFPLIAPGAMLIEPTESESKMTLDSYILAMRQLMLSIQAGEGEAFKSAPHKAPRERLDEARAARQPKLTWGA